VQDDTAVAASKRRVTDNLPEHAYEAIDAIVTSDCGPEMAVCFDDGECGYLFMVGSVTRSSGPLQNLLKCVEDFDSQEFNYFRATLADVDTKLGQCVANLCAAEYLACQVSLDCFLGKDTGTARKLQACVDLNNCVSTSTPTVAPTPRPSVVNDAEATGLMFEIDGDAKFRVDFKHITAGNLQAVPTGGAAALAGTVLVTAKCDPTDDGAIDLNGVFLIVTKACNPYDTARIAANGGAIAVAFAVDGSPEHRWLPRDRMLNIPVLSLAYDVAASVETMVRRGKSMRGYLSSPGSCDAMHFSGLPIDTALPRAQPIGGDSCCVAGDIVTSHLLFGHDAWNLGSREFPFCRSDSSQGDLTVGCIEPMDMFGGSSADIATTVCGNQCKRNGVCEDGGGDSVAHSCPWGGDCQDCGPRVLADLGDGGSAAAASGVAYGRPTAAEYEAAFQFMCGSIEGSRCQDALAAKYAEFHGEHNVYTSIVGALCLDTTCALQGGLLNYEVPAGSGGATCCFAAQIVSLYLLEEVFQLQDLSEFDHLCNNGLETDLAFDFECIERNSERPSDAPGRNTCVWSDDGFCDDGGPGSDFDLCETGTDAKDCDTDTDTALATVQPQLSANSFDLAREKICRGGSCRQIAETMLSDTRRQAAEEKSRASGADVVPLFFHFPLEQICSAAEDEGVGGGFVELCALLPFAEYLTTTEVDSVSNAAANTLTCCEASATVIADLMRQADRGTFDAAVCPPESAACHAVLALLDGHLGDAKDTLKRAPTCASTAWHLVEAMQDSGGNDDGGAGGFVHGRVLGHMTRARFDAYIDTEDVCWLQWSGVDRKPMDKPLPWCEAADAVLARHVWLQAPAIAPEIYAYSLYIGVNDELVARALSTICSGGWATELDDFVGASSFGKVLGAMISFEAMCNDPCRCKVNIPDAAGCGFHAGYDAGGDGGDDVPGRSRPFCFVEEPTSCPGAAQSSVLDGEAWTHCSVGYSTCQTYGGIGPCSPFVPVGAEVFVPAGATFESLQFIGDGLAVSLVDGDSTGSVGESVGLATESNLLDAWLLEAALVSPASYKAHGQFICDSRLRRCAAPRKEPEPQPLCHSDCFAAMAVKQGQDVVFNDLLRKFEADAVCGSRWLPKGFHGSAIAAGDDVEKLHGVLGMSVLLATPSVGGTISNFAQHVYPNAESAACFSSAVGTPAFDVVKAQAQIANCPDRFLKNNRLGASTPLLSGEPEAQFCVGTCPSNALSEAEYSSLWWVLVLPGFVAFAINVSALACLSSGVLKKDSTVASTLLVIRLAAVAGLLGIVPVALFGENLVCDCKTELCFSSGALCKLNQASIYVVMAVCLALLLKFAALFVRMRKMSSQEPMFDNWRVRILIWAVPLFFAAVSFGVEETGNERFHLAKSGMRCQFRYGSLLEESLLLHIPMCLCVCAMTYFVQATMRLCFQVMLLQCKERNLSSLYGVMKSRPQLLKMQKVSTASIVLMILWLTQAVASGSVFRNYLDSLDAWFRCVRFDFARHTALGAGVWQEVLASSSDGNLCPSSPTGAALFESHLLKGMFESLLPGLVAATFSWKILTTLMAQWQQSHPKFKLSTARGGAVAPQPEPAMPQFGSCIDDSDAASSVRPGNNDVGSSHQGAAGGGDAKLARAHSTPVESSTQGAAGNDAKFTRAYSTPVTSGLSELCRHGSQRMVLTPEQEAKMKARVKKASNATMTDGDLEWETKWKTRVSVTTMAIPEIEEVVERPPELPLPLLAPLTLGANTDDAEDHTENERNRTKSLVSRKTGL
jgi:hypothetical protein